MGMLSRTQLIPPHDSRVIPIIISRIENILIIHLHRYFHNIFISSQPVIQHRKCLKTYRQAIVFIRDKQEAVQPGGEGNERACYFPIAGLLSCYLSVQALDINTGKHYCKLFFKPLSGS